jgi:hypothetical protein
MRVEVKAVTRRCFRVEQTEQAWEAVVILALQEHLALNLR